MLNALGLANARLGPLCSYKALIARGTPKQNEKYCTKDDTRAPGHWAVRLGKPVTQGERTDLSAYCDAIAAGTTMRELAATFPAQLLKFPRGTDSLRHALSKPRDSAVPNTVVVFAGNTGSGKTWKAHDELRSRFGDKYYVCEGTPARRCGTDGAPLRDALGA